MCMNISEAATANPCTSTKESINPQYVKIQQCLDAMNGNPVFKGIQSANPLTIKEGGHVAPFNAAAMHDALM